MTTDERAIDALHSAGHELEQLRARVERLEERLSHIVSWLRGQANSEKEPKAKAAFIEAHNAVLGIAEGRYDSDGPEAREALEAK